MQGLGLTLNLIHFDETPGESQAHQSLGSAVRKEAALSSPWLKP